MQKVVARGNGTVGDDITSNARIVGGVPLRLDTKTPPPVLEIRGEVVILNEDFTSNCLEPRLPRHTSGI